MDEPARTPHMVPMSERRGNIFRFRRLKWGNPRRLEGLRAIGLESARPNAAGEGPRRGGPGVALGLVVVGVAAGFAIVTALLGGF
jgi:hypothetical protein